MRKRIEKGISVKPARPGSDRWVREQNEAYEKWVEELNMKLFGSKSIGKGVGSGSEMVNKARQETRDKYLRE